MNKPLGFHPEIFPEECRAEAVSLYNKVISQQEEIHRLRKELYGKKSEKLPKLEEIKPKGLLFNEAEAIAQSQTEEEDEAETKEGDKKNTTRTSKGRKKKVRFSDSLPREDVLIDLPEQEKFCKADGTPLKKIGEEIVEKLEVIPAQFKVKRLIYPRYACPCCDGGVHEPKREVTLLPKTPCTPSLLALLVSNKYSSALPLYRQEQLMKENGVEISSSSTARWMIKVSRELKPLIDELKSFIVSHNFIHADESTIQILHGKNKIKLSQKSYMWLMSTPKKETPAVYFEVGPSRSKDVAARLLKDFQGTLQVDGYAGYDTVTNKPDVTRVGCWAHVRRKFHDAFTIGAKNGRGHAQDFLLLIRQLYEQEKEWEELSPEERTAHREKHLTPIYDSIQKMAEKLHPQLASKTKIQIAVTYLLNQWQTLLPILKDGRIPLDNNWIENQVRPFAVGRRNWLFSSAVEGAEASATFYSLMQTAKLNGWKTYEYFKKLFTDYPLARVRAEEEGVVFDATPFLPWNMSQD